MAGALSHKFVSAKADGPDPTLVRASNWNASHAVSGGADGQKLVRDSTQTDGWQLLDAETCSLTNRTGGAHVAGDVVGIRATDDLSVVLDDTLSSVRKFVVALQANADMVAGAYAKSGIVPGVKAQGAIARGDYVRKSATTKAVESTGVAMDTIAAPPYGSLGIALTAAAASLVTVMWFDRPVGAKAPTVQVFTSGSGATYTTPANVAYIDIEMVGGGGGGCGGNNTSNAGSGGASTWSGGSLSAGGGGAGQSNGQSISSGAATGGNILNLLGTSGTAPSGVATNASGAPGAGSVFGGAGYATQAGPNAGANAQPNTGAGGAGGGVGPVNNPGGGGGAGSYVRHRIANPAATYTYTVGAGGAGGTAGANAGAGGAGAAGIIIVTEHYI